MVIQRRRRSEVQYFICQIFILAIFRVSCTLILVSISTNYITNLLIYLYLSTLLYLLLSFSLTVSYVLVFSANMCVDCLTTLQANHQVLFSTCPVLPPFSPHLPWLYVPHLPSSSDPTLYPLSLAVLVSTLVHQPSYS